MFRLSCSGQKKGVVTKIMGNIISGLYQYSRFIKNYWAYQKMPEAELIKMENLYFSRPIGKLRLCFDITGRRHRS